MIDTLTGAVLIVIGIVALIVGKRDLDQIPEEVADDETR